MKKALVICFCLTLLVSCANKKKTIIKSDYQGIPQTYRNPHMKVIKSDYEGTPGVYREEGKTVISSERPDNPETYKHKRGDDWSEPEGWVGPAIESSWWLFK